MNAAESTQPIVNQSARCNLPASPSGSTNPNTKFWGIWLPVPTLLAIVTTLFFTWLILSTVGFTEAPLEKASEPIIEKF